MTTPGEIRCRARRTVYSNNWMKVREDDVLFPNGTTGIFGVIEKPDFVAVIPVDAERRIHLVEQYRYPIGVRSWEIPQGSVAGAAGATPEEAARTELREETGFTAAHMLHVGHMYQAGGFSAQAYEVYVASGLTPGPTARESTESDMISGSFTLDEVRRMVAEGVIHDATTVAAFGHLWMSGQVEAVFGPGAL